MSDNFSLDLQGLSDDLILHVMSLGSASSAMPLSSKRFYQLGQDELLWHGFCESKGLKKRGECWKATYEMHCRCGALRRSNS